MSERTFFRGHSDSKILAVTHVIKGGQIVDHSINKTRIISTVLTINKTEGFRSSKKVRFGLLNWLFGFQSKISLVFPKKVIMTMIAWRRNLGKEVYLGPKGDLFWED